MLNKPYGDRCETCRFWNNSRSAAHAPDLETGMCLRNAPGFDSRTGLSVWPFTEENEWCGKFERNPDFSDDDEEDESHG